MRAETRLPCAVEERDLTASQRTMQQPTVSLIFTVEPGQCLTDAGTNLIACRKETRCFALPVCLPQLLQFSALKEREKPQDKTLPILALFAVHLIETSGRPPANHRFWRSPDTATQDSQPSPPRLSKSSQPSLYRITQQQPCVPGISLPY